MTWSLAGSVIDQDAGTTDNDLSGLAAIAGVTAIQIGTGDFSFNVYDIGTLRIDVFGTLNISPYHEMVLCSRGGDDKFLVRSGGTLNINGSQILNGVTRYTENLWLYLTGNNGADQWTEIGLRFMSGSIVNWVGGAVVAPDGTYFDAGSTINITNGVIDQIATLDDGSARAQEPQIRQSSAGLNVNGFKVKRGFFTLLTIPATLTGYAPEHCDKAFGFSSGTPNADVPITGYETEGDNTMDIAFWSGCRPVMTNNVNGTLIRVGPNGAGSVNSYGYLRVLQEFNPQIVSGDGLSVEGIRIWVEDNDNGNRDTYTGEGYSGVDPNQTFIYSALTDASGNLATDLVINTGFVVVNTDDATSHVAVNSGPSAWDYRCASNDTTDDFLVRVASYLHGLTSYTAIMKGAEAVTAGTTLFADPAITETTEATALAYTTVEAGVH